MIFGHLLHCLCAQQTPASYRAPNFLRLNAGKNQLVSFDRSKTIGAIDVKMDASVLEEKL